MTHEEFRHRIEDELAGTEPPLGDLVGAAVAEGRRMRTRRRFYAGAGSAAVLAAVVAGGMAFAGAGSPATPLGPAGRPPAAAAEFGAGQANDGPTKTATPQGALELLTRVLPKGRMDHYAGVVNADGFPTVQTYLDRGDGPGMIRVGLFRVEEPFLSPAAAKAHWQAECVKLKVKKCSAGSGITVSPAVTLPGGIAYQVARIPGNCIEDTVVTVHHADGTGVAVQLATCLAWDGTQNARGRLALPTKEAVAIASDPRWRLQMDLSLVVDGARHFPDLATLS
jgi:hypothetical protein